jgi:2'-5' RNA ligase
LSQNLIRCFVALEIKDERVKDKIAEIQRAVIDSGADLKPVERDNLHFTLRFLGEIPLGKVEKVKMALSKVEQGSFEAELGGIGVFPSLRRINVIWIGVTSGSEEIEGLYRKVNDALSPIFPKQKENFIPHLTIARVRTGKNKERLVKVLEGFKEVEVGRVLFNEFQFKKSTLTPRGPIYEDLKVYPLK